jgi:hypothetical protein
MEIDEPYSSEARSIVTPGTTGSQTRTRSRASSFRRPSLTRLRASMSSMATSITQLVPLPVVSEMVEGFQAYQVSVSVDRV